MTHAFNPAPDAATLPQPAGLAPRQAPLSRPPSFVHLAAVLASAAALAVMLPGCGSSSTPAEPPVADNPPPPPPPPPPPSVAISGVVADGPLQGATACYDLNDNGACDAGEPTSAATPADGSFTIQVLTPDAGQHAVIVNVPATAVDQTTNAAIGTALTFKAPATGNGGVQSVFVSPLTTMVLGQMQATGNSATEAAAFIQAQAGLSVSPLGDFTGSSDGQRQAALVARLAVQTQVALASAMAPRLGQADAGGGTIVQADIQAAVASALRSALPALAAAANAPAITGATNVQAALVAAAQDLLTTQPTLDTAAALATVATDKLPSALPAASATATAALRGFSYTDAGNWTYRVMTSDASDNTPDGAGLVRFQDIHKAATAGVISTWGFGTLEARKGDLHWNGSAWVGCPLGLRSTQTQRDAAGRSTYDYCNGHEKGSSTRSVIDIAGLTLASVITTKIRSFPGDDNGVDYANWGPANLGALGSVTFPAGAQLFYQTTVPTFNAWAYDVTSPVTTFGPAAAAGGDTTVNDTLACGRAFTGAISASNVATLEELVANNPGNLCRVNLQTDAGGASLNPNIWWSASSVSLGTVAGGAALPAGTGTFFTTSANLRVAFTGGNALKYFSCHVRTNGSSARNCNEVGTGTFAITATQADGRVMTFNNLPAIAQRLNFERVFVQRGGTVYFGYRNASNITRSTIRLNLPAANALFSTLGMAPITP